MERRDFLIVTSSFCFLASASVITGSLTWCSKLPIYKTVIHENKITVPVLLFEQADLQIVRSKQLNYDIALQKEKDGTFTALLRCTHADNQLISTSIGLCAIYMEAGLINMDWLQKDRLKILFKNTPRK